MGCGVPPRAAAPRGERLEASLAASNRREVGEQVVGEQDRLRPLQVRVAGQDYFPVCLRHLDERPHRREHAPAYAPGRFPDEEVQVEGHLVVAAAARVQLERHVADVLAQPTLHGRVYVLVGEAPGEPFRLHLPEHHLQTALQLGGFLFCHDPLLAEHLRVRDGAPDVVGGEAHVEGDRGVQALEGFGRARPEPSAPERRVVFFIHGRAV